MKTIYIIVTLLLFAGLNGKAQLTLTKSANEPAVGDIHTMVSHDSTTAVPRNMGTNQTWDFSSMTANTQTEVITYTTTSSVPESSLFPGATLAALRGSNNKEFFVSSGNDFNFIGEFKVGSGDRFFLSNSALFMRWPVSISSSFTDVAVGTEVSGTSSTAVTATLSHVASGTGTVILPGGIIHNNCLQVTSLIVVITGTGVSTAMSWQMSYKYYSSNRKLPIADIQYSEETHTSGTSKDFSAYLDRSPLSTGLDESFVLEDFKIFPNPASDCLSLILPIGYEKSSIDITDSQGKVVKKVTDTSELNVQSLPNGIYNMSVRSNDGVLMKKFVVNR